MQNKIICNIYDLYIGVASVVEMTNQSKLYS